MIRVSIDGLEEPEFRWQVETLLRVGKADEAFARLKTLLPELCGDKHPLPDHFLTANPAQITLEGWNDLSLRIKEYDQPGKDITAIGIDFSSPSHFGEKASDGGFLDPHLETNFYSDQCCPFSTADRTRLLEYYNPNKSRWLGGPKWGGCFEEIDDTLSVKGLGELYGAVSLCSKLPNPTDADKQAKVVGACFVAVLLHLAVRNSIAEKRLPRPMAVIVGSNDDYPFFNAVVSTAH